MDIAARRAAPVGPKRDFVGYGREPAERPLAGRLGRSR